MPTLFQLQQRLPKPILFALYGGAGALLGALVLGEIVWALLRPPAAKSGVPPLILAASPAVSVYLDGENRFAVNLASDGWAGSVKLEAVGLPAGVTVTGDAVPAGRSEGELKVSASAAAAVGKRSITIRATGEPASGSAPTAEATVELSVLEPPPALRLAASPRVELHRGARNRFLVRVARDRFTGPVNLTLTGLAFGVTAAPVTLAAGQDQAEVEVAAGAGAEISTKSATLQGSGQAGGVTASVPIQVTVDAAPRVDVLILLDVTGSMGGEIKGVKDGIVNFVRALEQKNLDARVGVLAFRDTVVDPADQALVLLRFGSDKEVFTSNARLVEQEVGQLVAGGGGDAPESVLDALALAVRQPFRPRAAKVFLVICDDAPRVPDGKVASLREGREMLEQAGVQMHLVIRSRFKPVYKELKGTLTGEFFDLDSVSRGKTSLAEALPTTLGAAIASDLPNALPASARPAPLPSAGASAAAPPPAPPVLRGVQSDQSFASDASTSLRLALATGCWTAVVAALLSLALVGGQEYYLRQDWPGTWTIAKGLAGGLAAGLVGGTIGQALFQMTSGIAGAEAVFRVFGWSILGALVGLGLSVFVPNLRPSRGLLGGMIGGVIGALGFLFVVGLLRGWGGDFFARLAGSLLLGLAVGLMVALAERMFREAWLEVRFGANEVITVNLGPEPLKVGSDSKLCTVYARGAAPVALRYWVREGQVVCEDVPARNESEAWVDVPRQVGNLTLTVRTALVRETAEKSEPPPPMAIAVPTPPPAAKPLPPPVAPNPPAPKPLADPNACPGGCGRKLPAGPPGKRYCVVCDKDY